MTPYKRNMGQRINTDVDGISVNRAFLAHLNISAANAVAASNTGVHAGVILQAGGQSLAVNLTDPEVPRALRIKGNVAGIAGDVVITGTNYAGEEIEETFALNGTDVIEGAKAFKTITDITFPARTHVPAHQVETIAVTAGSDKIATLVVTVTAAGMDNSPKAINVDVTADDDTTAEVAAKIRAALDADPDVGAYFTVSGADANIILTTIGYADDDGTLAIALSDADTSTVTVGASGNTTGGVAQDIVSIGWNDKLGLPYMLTHNTVIPGMTFLNNVREGTEPTVTTDIDEIEKNTVDLNSALAGTAVDIYLVV